MQIISCSCQTASPWLRHYSPPRTEKRRCLAPESRGYLSHAQQLEEEELVTGEKIDSKIIYRLTDKGQKEVKASMVEGPWESDEEMFRHVAWIKEMTTQLTQSYLRMIRVADTETIEVVHTRTEKLLELMQKETK